VVATAVAQQSQHVVAKQHLAVVQLSQHVVAKHLLADVQLNQLTAQPKRQ
jgi:hypothetical protein